MSDKITSFSQVLGVELLRVPTFPAADFQDTPTNVLPFPSDNKTETETHTVTEPYTIQAPPSADTNTPMIILWQNQNLKHGII